MIDPLKNDRLVEKIGGRFKLTALIQKRWNELIQGSRPMVDVTGKTDLEIIVEEIAQDKIAPLSEKEAAEKAQADDEAEQPS